MYADVYKFVYNHITVRRAVRRLYINLYVQTVIKTYTPEVDGGIHVRRIVRYPLTIIYNFEVDGYWYIQVGWYISY